MATTPQPRSVRDLKDANALADKRREMETLRSRDKIDWALNREFYKGNQWAWWNRAWPNGGRLENEPVDEGDKPHYKVRLTISDLQDLTQHWVAQLTKNRPIVTGTPESGSDRDLKAAQMATSLWEYWWQEFELDQKVQTSLLDASISQGFWHISWDQLAGKPLSFMVSPQGMPLVSQEWDEDALDTYRDALRDEGVDPQMFERTVMVGDIAVKPLPGENVLLDPAARNFEDAKYAIVKVSMDTDELFSRWPKGKNGESTADVKPDATVVDETLVPPGLNQDSRMKTVRQVYYGYFKPNPILPKGRHVIWIESPNMVLEDSDWPFPFTDLPLVHFPGIERPDSALDMPRLTAARPFAKQMNRSISQVIEHQNLTLRPQVLAPRGSLEERLTNEPGRVVYFNPINGAVPQWRDIPALPSYVFDTMTRLDGKLNQLFNRMPSQRDAMPARIDSAGAIDLIQESVADQLTPVIRRLEASLVRGAMLMIKLAQKYYTEPRLLQIKGPNGAVQAKKFLNADLKGGFGFRAEAGSGLPRTRAGKQARIEFMLQNNLIDQQTALKYLDTADMTGLMAKVQAAEEAAYRTVERIKKGQPLNITAYQQAMQQVQAMMADPTADPDGDGQPDSPQEKMQAAQQILMQAAMQPLGFEDPHVHLDVLTQFMDSVEFENLDLQTQQAFIARYNAMLQFNAQIAQMSAQMQAPVQRPRVSYQIKSSVGPTAASEILNETGVQVQPEDMAEPPLDTWVSDDLTKPAAQESGNTHLDEAQKLQAMEQDQQTHALKMAQAAHQVRLAAAKADGAQRQAVDANPDARAEEAHQQQLAHAEQMHQAKLAQAKKGPAKSGG